MSGLLIEVVEHGVEFRVITHVTNEHVIGKRKSFLGHVGNYLFGVRSLRVRRMRRLFFYARPLISISVVITGSHQTSNRLCVPANTVLSLAAIRLLISWDARKT
jgi:hypothetical protein